MTYKDSIALEDQLNNACSNGIRSYAITISYHDQNDQFVQFQAVIAYNFDFLGILPAQVC